MGLEQLRSAELKERNDSESNETGIRNGGISKHGKKPLMERYRRQKINNYLEELKCLVLSALNKEVSRYNKMEKADILDMAVKYVKAVQTSTPETSPREYRQQHEYRTPMVPGYQVPRSFSPLGVNTNCDYLFQSSPREVQNDEMKENRMVDFGKERFSSFLPQPTRTLGSAGYSQQQQQQQQQVHSPLQKRTTTISLARPTKKYVDTQTNTGISSQIWRPW